MKYYIIAGEASGDLHGANLIKALKVEDKEPLFRFVGGDQMESQVGEKPFLHISEMAFMGFIEVIKNLKTISRNLKKVKEAILDFNPDTLILIDYPGFNIRIASFAKKHNIKVCYYISPKIWAWNQSRVHKIKKVVDHMFCILPFEVDFYKRFNMEVNYVGNPLLDAISSYRFNPNFLTDNNLTKRPIIALLPGSRIMEIEKILPDMLGLYYAFPQHQIIIAAAPNLSTSFYQNIIGNLEVPLVFDQTYDLLKHAEVAVVTSGTATLEAGILKVPQVVVYKANPISVAIARKLIKVKYISLVNLINGFLSVIELIQTECNTSNIKEELGKILTDSKHRESILENYEILEKKLGTPGASERTAKLIMKTLSD